mmetsp:Transcript_33115/g.79984  ORF Transcript_33115/g.79984 Transcript_33115/m.79984 type:complete len:216 (-) Transcript_33115:6625-7272(-)
MKFQEILWETQPWKTSHREVVIWSSWHVGIYPSRRDQQSSEMAIKMSSYRVLHDIHAKNSMKVEGSREQRISSQKLLILVEAFSQLMHRVLIMRRRLTLRARILGTFWVITCHQLALPTVWADRIPSTSENEDKVEAKLCPRPCLWRSKSPFSPQYMPRTQHSETSLAKKQASLHHYKMDNSRSHLLIVRHYLPTLILTLIHQCHKAQRMKWKSS